MMKKLLFILIFTLVLPSCSVLSNYGYYADEDNAYNTYPSNDEGPIISVPFFLDESCNNRNIMIKFPHNIGINYGLLIWFIVPFPAFSGVSIEKSPQRFRIYVKGHIKSWEYVVDLLKVSVKTQDGKIYHGKNDSKEKSRFYFPIKIKDIGEKGVLILEYKDIKKEIAFKYGRGWYFKFVDGA